MKKKMFTMWIALLAIGIQVMAQPVVGKSYKILDTKQAVAVTAHPDVNDGGQLQFDDIIAGETPDPSQVFTLEDAGNDLFYIKSEIADAGYITYDQGNLTYSQTPTTKFYAEQLDDNPDGSYSIIAEGINSRFLTFNLDWIYFKVVDGGETPNPGVDGTSFVFISLNGNGGDDDTDLPIVPSTDTGDGAVWYFMYWDTGDGTRPMYSDGPTLDAGLNIRWGEPEITNESFQFCFVGDNENGFSIYNKAFLAGKTVQETVDGNLQPRVLTEDLAIQNLGSGEQWARGGFSINAPTNGNLINKWKIWLGTENDKPEGRDVTGLTAIYHPDYYFWWIGGASCLEFGATAGWGGAWAIRFTQAADPASYTYSTIPASGAVAVDLDASIIIEFNNEIHWTKITANTIKLIPQGSDESIAFTFSVQNGNKLVIVPTEDLAPETTYEVIIGTGAIAPFVTSQKVTSWSFTTKQGSEIPFLKEARINAYAEKGKLILTSESAQPLAFSVSNILGQTVKHGSLLGRSELSLPSGIYLLKTSAGSKKLIVK